MRCVPWASSLCQTTLSPSKLRGPELARHPVAADVGAGEVLEALAAVDVAAGDGGGLGVREGEGRRQDRRRAALALGLDRLRAFHDRPAVVAALLDAVDHLPQLPADVADPQVAGRAVEAHPPGVAEAVGPDLRPGVRRLDERVVRRDGVGLALVLVVHVDAQDRREQVADVLAGVEARRAGSGWQPSPVEM